MIMKRILDPFVIFGLIVGISSIIVGNIVEGGTTAHILQLAAALIVFGGTFGATVVSFPMKDLVNAFKVLKIAFFKSVKSDRLLIEEIISLLVIARKRGIMALENEIPSISDPLLAKGIQLIVDGYEINVIKEAIYREIKNYEDSIKNAAKVFDAAGGFAPTIGIIGAVLGLIHVLQNVTDPSKVGQGIAVAFVATIYGVGSANLVFIPIGKRILQRAKDEIKRKLIIMEGITGIEKGINPHYLRVILESFKDGGKI
ncbi:Flagellar motor rotation protein MotA [Thermodesulfovibrio sp. N1]|nr:Flagellar motor rotation protein MotA [Thermodesulfovibrio sp. N1]